MVSQLLAPIAVLALCGIFNVATFVDALQWSQPGSDILPARLGHAAGGMVKKALGENDLSHMVAGATDFAVTSASGVTGVMGGLAGLSVRGLISLGKNESPPSFTPK